MDLIVWARENPVLVITALAIAVLIVVAMRMARVPDSAEEPHPPAAQRPSAERAIPPRTPFARTSPGQPAPSSAPMAPPAVPAGAHDAPAGYVPLEVPALWEPPVGYLAQARGASFAPAASAHRASPPPRPQQGYPAGYPARALPRVHPAVRTQTGAPAPAAGREQPAAAPRSFDDLRRGALAGRTFDSLQQFAVAAVVEAGYPLVHVARIFRVPSWKLESWVEASFHAPPPAHRPWRGTMPRAV